MKSALLPLNDSAKWLQFPGGILVVQNPPILEPHCNEYGVGVGDGALLPFLYFFFNVLWFGLVLLVSFEVQGFIIVPLFSCYSQLCTFSIVLKESCFWL